MEYCPIYENRGNLFNIFAKNNMPKVPITPQEYIENIVAESRSLLSYSKGFAKK